MGVFAHTLIIIVPVLNAGGLQSKHHLVCKAIIIIIILHVWCSLKSVTTIYSVLIV